MSVQRRRRRVGALLATIFLVAAGLAGAPTPARASGGSVDLLYAGSLLNLVQQRLGPAFTRATGDAVNGYPDGSDALVSTIKGGTQRADVLLAAAPSADRRLMGPANGDWISRYRVIGTSPLVLAYDPASRFASALRHEPWYRVVGRPGFRLGRTDPLTDPKGVLARHALADAARRFRVPTLATLARNDATVFPEATLVGRLQAGQLDAGFFYLVEVRSAHLTSVPLTGEKLAATFTVALVRNAPDPRAARAFVAFLETSKARALLAQAGIRPAARAPHA